MTGQQLIDIIKEHELENGEVKISCRLYDRDDNELKSEDVILSEADIFYPYNDRESLCIGIFIKQLN